MGSNKLSKLLLPICLLLIGGFSLWKMQQPGRDAWNYAVASSIADYYNDAGLLPKDQDELLMKLGSVDVERGFLSALGEMKFRGISEDDFFSGGDLIELSENQKKQKLLNDFIRNACTRERGR
jgi:hypothetical protein